MKRNLFLSMLGAAILMLSCAPEVKVIENPMFEVANSETFDFTKIEITDTATYLTAEAYYRPHYWVKTASDTYLQVDGKKYTIISAEGCELDKEFWMPQSGRATFRFKFPQIPKRAKKMDYIEGDAAGHFRVMGIDLKGKRKYEDYLVTHPDIPKELLSFNKEATLPQPITDVGKTTITVHLLNYQEGILQELTIINNATHGSQDEITAPVNQQEGTVTFEFTQYGTSEAWIMDPNIYTVMSRFLIAPNDKMDIYVDMSVTAQRIIARREGKDHEKIQYKSYIDGTFKDYCALLNTMPERLASNDMELIQNFYAYGKGFADYRWSAEEYKKNIEEKYRNVIDAINSMDNLLPFDKEYFTLQTNLEYASAILFHGTVLATNYHREHNTWNQHIDRSKFAQLSEEQMKEMFSLLKYDPRYELFLFDIGHHEFDEYINAPKNSLVAQREIYQSYFNMCSQNLMNEKAWENLEKVGNDFITKACKTRHAEVLETLAKVEGKAKIEPTPEVADDELFDAIIAPHKGKVICVDFWNTWCGPCRQMHKVFAGYKAEDLKDRDIVWIYIASDSSPEAAYRTMIPEISGLHYRLNYKQWNVLCKKFNIEGIPSYVIVDKNGKAEFQKDDHPDAIRRKLIRMTNK